MKLPYFLFFPVIIFSIIVWFNIISFLGCCLLIPLWLLIPLYLRLKIILYIRKFAQKCDFGSKISKFFKFLSGPFIVYLFEMVLYGLIIKYFSSFSYWQVLFLTYLIISFRDAVKGYFDEQYNQINSKLTKIEKEVTAIEKEIEKVELKVSDVKLPYLCGETALMQAAKRGHADAVVYCIRAGADLNAKDDEGRSALMYAAQNDHAYIMRVLVNAGAGINARDNEGRSVLMYAAENGCYYTIEEMLYRKRKPDINVKDRFGKTALMYLAAYGHSSLVESLIRTDAIIFESEYSDEPLNAAGLSADFIKNKYYYKFYGRGRSVLPFESIKKLVEAGANINEGDNEGVTALIHAAKNNQIEAVRALINFGADINAKDKKGLTAFMYAYNEGNYDVIQALVDADAEMIFPKTAE